MKSLNSTYLDFITETSAHSSRKSNYYKRYLSFDLWEFLFRNSVTLEIKEKYRKKGLGFPKLLPKKKQFGRHQVQKYHPHDF